MNRRQRLALAQPMARATDPVEGFRHTYHAGAVKLSTILTVNK